MFIPPYFRPKRDRAFRATYYTYLRHGDTASLTALLPSLSPRWLHRGLAIAVLHEQYDVMAMLLKAGADVTYHDYRVLHLIARYGTLTMLRQLKQHGACLPPADQVPTLTTTLTQPSFLTRSVSTFLSVLEE